MMSFEKNPYSWTGGNITGTVGSVSLTRMDGTVIPVENLPEDIEVMFVFPRSFLKDFALNNTGRLHQNHVFCHFLDPPAEAWRWSGEQHRHGPRQFQHINNWRSCAGCNTGAENGAVWRHFLHAIPGIQRLSNGWESCGQDSDASSELHRRYNSRCPTYFMYHKLKTLWAFYLFITLYYIIQNMSIILPQRRNTPGCWVPSTELGRLECTTWL